MKKRKGLVVEDVCSELKINAKSWVGLLNKLVDNQRTEDLKYLLTIANDGILMKAVWEFCR